MGKKKKKEDPRPVSDPSTEAPALSFDGETLTSVFGMYPGYMGNLVASGFATVRFNADGNFLFKLDVEGVPENCTKCGVHIHTGFTCDNATLVGPHYWNLETLGQGIANDPWYIYGYYNATDLGKSQTAFVGNSGNGYGLNIGRAAVLHDGVSVTTVMTGSVCFERRFLISAEICFFSPSILDIVLRMELALRADC